MNRSMRILGLLMAAVLALSACDFFTSAETRVARATEQIAAGDFRTAVFELRKVLDDEPGHVQARLLLAEAEFGSGDIASAETDLDRALASGADAKAAAPLKARLQLAFGRHQILLTQLDTGEIALPEAQSQFYRGHALLGLGRAAEAEQAFEAVLKAEPGLLDARVARAEARAAQGDSAGALKQLAELTRADPDAALAWLALGGLQLQQGRHADADASMAKALEHGIGRQGLQMQVQALAAQVDARLSMDRVDRAQQALGALQKSAPGTPIARLMKARVDLARGDAPAAIAELTGLTNDLPDFLPARYLLGSALLLQGSLYQAERHLAAVVQASPNDLEARKRLAEVQLRMNRPESAIDLLGSSLEGINDPRAIALLGAAQLGAGADPSAIQRLEEALATRPDDRGTRLDLAGLYITAGDAGKAIKLLQAMPRDRKDTRRDFLLIRALAVTEGEAPARSEIERMMRENPDDTARLNLAAKFLESFGDRAAAIAALEKALAVKSDDVPTLINLGRARLAEGKPDDAEALLRRALSHDGANVDARIALAEIAGRRGQNDEARRLLEEIRIDDARAVASRLLLARLYLSSQETAKASKVLADALAAAPGRSDVLVAAGALQQEYGQNEQALGYFRKAADLEPQQPAHWVNVARAQLALGYLPAARESVGRALKLDPDMPDAVALAVKLDLADGKEQVALARLAELCRRRPDDPGAAMLQGDTLMSLGRHREAEQAFEAAARLQKSLAATVRLTQARQLQGERDALAPVEAWLKQRPQDRGARAMYAIFLDQGGHKDAAVREYERVLAEGQPDAVMANNLAILYQERGDSRAEAMARQARRLAPTNAAIADTLGWILVGKGAREEGIRLLREAANLAPQEPDIQLHLAEALLGAGQKAEARQILIPIVNGTREFPGREQARELLRRAGN